MTAVEASLETFSDHRGEIAHLIELREAGAVVAAVTPEEARRLARRLERLADETEPFRRDAFTAICDALGTPLETLATVADVDLETATRADEETMAHAIGRSLGHDDWSVRIGADS